MNISLLLYNEYSFNLVYKHYSSCGCDKGHDAIAWSHVAFRLFHQDELKLAALALSYEKKM